MLRRVLDEASGPARTRIDRALHLLLEQVGMEVGFVAELAEDGSCLVTHTVGARGATPTSVGLNPRALETLCRLATTAETGMIVADAAAHPEVAHRPHLASSGVGAWAGVPLVVDGKVVGALCCAASAPVHVAESRDRATLRTVAEYVGTQLRPSTAATHAPPRDATPPADRDALDRVAQALADGRSIESLSRPLLTMLQEATGLDSTYLTAVDWAADEQRIEYAVNTAEMHIPEGLVVDWSDTLCRRSLDEGRESTSDVPSVWGDSAAAAALGITTYVSVPVLDGDSTVIGTLCGASGDSVEVDERHLATMRMFAALIGQQIAAHASASAQEQRAVELQSRLVEVDDLALRDPLTHLYNRRGIERWLDAASAGLRPGVDQLAVGFCDLDDFKRTNDTLGHTAGDDALRSFAAAIQTVGRGVDLHGRLGGDEFVVAAVLPATDAALGVWTDRLRHAARSAFLTTEAGERHRIGASVGVAAFGTSTPPDRALSAADAAMYREKTARRATR